MTSTRGRGTKQVTDRRRTPRALGTRQARTERWSSTTLFVFGASGAAIGFNNLWQFPYTVTQYGGGAFLIVYIFALLVLSLPLLSAEIMLGRSGRASPVTTLLRLSGAMRGGVFWALAGAMGILAGFIIFSYLSVIAGWVMAYTVRSALGVFTALTVDGVNSVFAQFVRDPEQQLFWHTAFIIVTLTANARGLRSGIEPVVKFAMPLVFVLLFGLLGYAMTTDAFSGALVQIFEPDFTKLSGTGVLTALSHAFFSVGVGIGVMLTYGAYLQKGASIPRASMAIVGIDLFVGVVGAVVVVSVVYAGGVELAAGPELVFQALPLAFDHLPYGRYFATAFFAVLVMVAWTTAIALIEPAVVWMQERFGWTRFRATVGCGIGAWILGAITVFSFNFWSFSFNFFDAVKKFGAFDLMQILTAHLLLPLTGILIAVFAGWIVKPDRARAELAFRSPCAFDVWLWLTRFALPLLLLWLLWNMPRLFA